MSLDEGSLFALFGDRDDVPRCERVPPADMPSPYRELLVHDQHMTVTVERFFGERVNVQVLDRISDETVYARKILLTLQSTDQVVQFGIPRIHLGYCRPEVAAAIREEKAPLGRILIEHDVFRRIEPLEFLRVTPGPAMCRWFQLPGSVTTYGRLAQIHCDGRPAIDLLEILAPIVT